MTEGSIEQLEQGGLYGRAFAEIQKHNASVLAGTDLATMAASVAARQRDIISKFDAARLAAATGGNGSRSPIFVIGMPRSGSTLIEQVLATHTRVHALGECVVLGDIASADVAWASPELATSGKLRSMGARYIESVRTLGWKSRTTDHFTDKSLGNYEIIGLIHLLFPHATIIEAQREPIDVCFSAFRASLAPIGDSCFTLELVSVGLQYRRYRAMMDHWRRVLPGRVVEIRLEDLVSDLEPTARRLVAACGLGWEPQCLRFYENPREVKTASADQVRRPIFTDSLGRWRHYKEHLGPLIEALGPYAPKDI